MITTTSILPPDKAQNSGVIIRLFGDARFIISLERAPDSGGVPGTWAEIVQLPAGSIEYHDPLPRTGTTYWYQARHIGSGFDPGPYTAAVSTQASEISPTTSAVTAVNLGLVAPLAPSLGGTGITAMAVGDMMFAGTTATWNLRSVGSTGQFLRVTGGVPVWAAITAADVGAGTFPAGSFIFSGTVSVTGSASNISFYITNTGAGGIASRFIAGKTGDTAAGGLALYDDTNAGYVWFANKFGVRFYPTVGIGVAPGTAYGILTTHTLTGLTSAVGAYLIPTFASDVTAAGYGLRVNAATAAAAFTMTSGIGILIQDWVKGAGSTITTQTGLLIAAQTQGASNWAIYTQGTTASYFGGAVTTGALTATSGAFSGPVGLGGAYAANVGIYLRGSRTAAAAGAYGILNQFVAVTAANSDTLYAYTNSSWHVDNTGAYTGINVVAMDARAPVIDAGTITGSYTGVQVSAASPASGVNNFGVKIGSITGAAGSNYALYTDTGLVRFGDAVTAPTFSALAGSGNWARLFNTESGVLTATANTQTFYDAVLNATVAVGAYTGITSYGLYVGAGAKTGAGTIATRYAVWAAAQTIGTSNYAFGSNGFGVDGSGGITGTTGNFTDTTDATSAILGSLKTAGGLAVAKDLWLGSFGRVDSTTAPGADYVVAYNSSVAKWQPRPFVLGVISGVVASGAWGGATAQYVNTNPTLSGTPAGGTPAAPAASAVGYLSIIVDMSVTTLPANCVYDLQYQDNGGGWSGTLSTTSSSVVHSSLTSGHTYTYQYRVRGATTGTWSTTSAGVQPSMRSETAAFGLVLASQIAVQNLAALSANVGVLTTGTLQDALVSPKYGIKLGGAWTGATPSVAYIDFTATGANPFISHTRLALNADGTAMFKGGLDITQSYINAGSIAVYIQEHLASLTHGMTDIAATDVNGFVTTANGSGGVAFYGLSQGVTSNATAVSLVAYTNAPSLALFELGVVNATVGKKSGTNVTGVGATAMAFTLQDMSAGVVWAVYGDGSYPLPVVANNSRATALMREFYTAPSITSTTNHAVWVGLDINPTLTWSNSAYYLDEVSGVRVSLTANNYTSNQVSKLYGVHIVALGGTATTRPDIAGIHIDTIAAGTGYGYGLYIADITAGGGVPFSIYTGLGPVRFGDTLTVVGAFGCNGATAQTAFASGGASGGTLAQTTTLANNIRTALVNAGIMS